ncbi:Rad52/Rad22 family DNA repair protein [Nostoc piscinale]|uniref:Rad52/Rad22 family DNA repair protein n=1 Tax=Nostoc piscinale TaxID=224012 RepID=UPI000781C574|nr:Rad52/Rad22 family DNA repair protein [Nostoc piscinale]
MITPEIREELRRIQIDLKKPFPPSFHQIRELPGKGYWAFVPHQVIRQRLDEVAPEWLSDFSSVEVLGSDAVCRCAITILGIRKEAIGSVPLVAATNKDGKDVSRGSAADRVSAEAFKNAAEAWGVGVYLDDQAFVATYLSKNAEELSDKVKNELRSLITYLRNKGELLPPNSTVSAKPIPKTQQSTVKEGSILHDMSGVSPAKTISKAQAQRLWAIARNELKLSDTDVKAVFVEFGVESTNNILATDYNKIIERLKAYGQF